MPSSTQLPTVLILGQSDEISAQICSGLAGLADVVVLAYHEDMVRAVENQPYDAAIIPLDIPGLDGEWLARVLVQKDPALCCIRQKHSHGVNSASLRSTVERAIDATRQRRNLAVPV